jgi:CheY-like chemotaxis protein
MQACKGRRVLVVDDDEFNRDVLSAILSMTGAEVVTAPDGFTALASLAAGRSFDAVLMDVQMPGMDGYEATRRIRANSELADLPVLAITANVMDGVRERCFEAGMNDFLTKPVDTPALVEALTRWINRRP